ncbi:hypothetical protein ACWEKT_10075 [Nocardia takedensis]
MSQPLHYPTVIEPVDAAAYLAQMGIQVSDLVDAIVAGELRAGTMTGHHPVTAAGLIRWIHVVGMLRERLAQTNQWFNQDPKNRPVSRRFDGAYSLSTVGGTEVTGIIDHPDGPRAARRRGPATAEAVNATAPLITVAALRAGSIHRDTDADLRARPPLGAWFLVYFRDEESVRMEVSLPLGFHDGQFTGWIVRVVLDEWRPDSASPRPGDIGGEGVDFEIAEVG